ncbi:MAG TPA: hypothetical protein VNA16_02700, partial [Abditibacteriaceae bacterium]|nr:hypothetical protein [Abditibacteriaceae bacterium]
ALTRPYERGAGDPLYRPLRIYALDPAVSRLEGAVAAVNVPFEPLQPGPVGRLFVVDDLDDSRGERYRRVDLDEQGVLIRDGRGPSPSDPQFHQQMVYAVCSTVYATFQSALGRHVAWGFDRPQKQESTPSSCAEDEEPLRLVIRPHACHDRNAYYDKVSGELRFGYFRAGEQVAGANLPGGWVFTCLSHDIIAHEVTHALLDGLRARFTFPSGAEVVAFHEAFADLVALFQRFTFEKVVQAAIQSTGGNLEGATLLTDIARQFGETSGLNRPLRSAIDLVRDAQQTKELDRYDADREPHAMGSRLVAAVFEAFITVFKRKVARYIRLATSGTGVLPRGDLPADLQAVLAEEASKLASHFLAMCIRAIDYCPPIDLEFGEFLRAVITADYDLVPDDPWAYREAWINAFRRRGIYPRGVGSLSVDALLWRGPRLQIERCDDLSFRKLQFDGDPGRPADSGELQRQACALGCMISDPALMQEFGLAPPGNHGRTLGFVDLPCVESVRSSRRAGPDGQVVFDLVAEVTQRRTVRHATNSRGESEETEFYGGATVILDPRGGVRYVISKNVLGQERLDRQLAFSSGPDGRQFWQVVDGKRRPVPQFFQALHPREMSDT